MNVRVSFEKSTKIHRHSYVKEITEAFKFSGVQAECFEDGDTLTIDTNLGDLNAVSRIATEVIMKKVVFESREEISNLLTSPPAKARRILIGCYGTG